jgi:hypothetical protein
MQTAVEWLIEQLMERGFQEKNYEVLEQAKEMEKEQLMDAYMARMDVTNKEHLKQIIGVQYYNETFKKD